MHPTVLPPFTCDVHPDRDRVIVAPSGELDVAEAPAVTAKLDELLDAGFVDVVVDLRHLTFLDSSGLNLLLRARSRARDREVRLSLIEGPPEVQRVFDLTRMAPLFSFVDPWTVP